MFNILQMEWLRSLINDNKLISFILTLIFIFKPDILTGLLIYTSAGERATICETGEF